MSRVPIDWNAKLGKGEHGDKLEAGLKKYGSIPKFAKAIGVSVIPLRRKCDRHNVTHLRKTYNWEAILKDYPGSTESARLAYVKEKYRGLAHTVLGVPIHIYYYKCRTCNVPHRIYTDRSLTRKLNYAKQIKNFWGLEHLKKYNEAVLRGEKPELPFFIRSR